MDEGGSYRSTRRPRVGAATGAASLVLGQLKERSVQGGAGAPVQVRGQLILKGAVLEGPGEYRVRQRSEECPTFEGRLEAEVQLLLERWREGVTLVTLPLRS